MVSIPSLNYNTTISSYHNMKKQLPQMQKLADKYEAEGNVKEQERYEQAVEDLNKYIPIFKRNAEKWARVAGIPEGKIGQILTPQEIKFYEKDRSGGATGFPDKLFPKGFGLDQYA